MTAIPRGRRRLVKARDEDSEREMRPVPGIWPGPWPRPCGTDRKAVLEVARFVDDFEMPWAAPLAWAPFFESRIVGGHVAPESENPIRPTESGAIASNRYISGGVGWGGGGSPACACPRDAGR